MAPRAKTAKDILLHFADKHGLDLLNLVEAAASFVEEKNLQDELKKFLVSQGRLVERDAADLPTAPLLYEKLQTRTAQERISIIQEWSVWFYDHTESLMPGDLGMQLAYLWGAVANAQKIEVEKSSALVRLLEDEGISEKSTIMEYIDIVDEETR